MFAAQDKMDNFDFFFSFPPTVASDSLQITKSGRIATDMKTDTILLCVLIIARVLIIATHLTLL